MKKRNILFWAIVGIATYTHFSDKKEPVQVAQSAEINPRLGEICKGAAAIIFGRSYNIMKLDKVSSDIAYVHYIRPNDGTRWAIKCRLDGSRVVWASNNPDSIGRWRNDPADEVVTYKIDGSNLYLKQVYSDGSGEEKMYTMN